MATTGRRWIATIKVQGQKRQVNTFGGYIGVLDGEGRLHGQFCGSEKAGTKVCELLHLTEDGDFLRGWVKATLIVERVENAKDILEVSRYKTVLLQGRILEEILV